MLLRRAAELEVNKRVYRVALNPDKWRMVNRIREELGDELEVTEALAFLGEPSELEPCTLGELLQIPFLRRPYPADRRFSNGEFGVLYTAATAETASREYAHWAPRNFAPTAGHSMRVRLHLLSCEFAGHVKDLRPFVEDCPWLIANDYSECQKLGAAAHAEGLAGLFAPSARDRPNGATVPIFLIDAASNPQVQGDVIFIVNATIPTTFEIKLA